MDPVEAIKRAQDAELVDADGHAVVLTLALGLSATELDELQAEIGAPLPRDLRAVLEHTAGIDDTALDGVDFTGRDMSYEDRDLFPLGLPIAADGFGNFWVLDLSPEETETACVFFACHDPPVILYQSPDLAHFLVETFRIQQPPHSSLVNDVHEDRLFNVWETNPGTIAHPEALAADEELRGFAEEAGDRFVFVDLRSPQIGMGFSWGRYGPRTEVRRYGFERIFACARSEARPGLLSRIFGRAG